MLWRVESAMLENWLCNYALFLFLTFSAELSLAGLVGVPARTTDRRNILPHRTRAHPRNRLAQPTVRNENIWFLRTNNPDTYVQIPESILSVRISKGVRVKTDFSPPTPPLHRKMGFLRVEMGFWSSEWNAKLAWALLKLLIKPNVMPSMLEHYWGIGSSP